MQKIQQQYAAEEKKHELGHECWDDWSCGVFSIALLLALPLVIILGVTQSLACWIIAVLYTILMIVLAILSCNKDGMARDLRLLSQPRGEFSLYTTYGVDKTTRIKNLYNFPQFQAAQDQFVRSIDNLCGRKSSILHPTAIVENDLLKAYRALVNDEEFSQATPENQVRSIIMEAMQQRM